MQNRAILIFFFFLIVHLESKPPQIGPKDVKLKVEEILTAHASHKRLSPELIERTLQNFLEELDPTKTYFLAPEIATWTKPSEEALLKILNGVMNADFAIFQEIHASYLGTIERRASIERKVENASLPKGVKSDEFKDISWVLALPLSTPIRTISLPVRPINS